MNIANPDLETKRLLKLGVPFTAAAMFEAFFDSVSVALVSRYLGVETLSAFVIAELLIGLSDTLVGGVADTLETLCAHAIGAENYFLAGQVSLAGRLSTISSLFFTIHF